VIGVWLLWIGGVALLVLFGLGYAATIPLMRRRVPDVPDHPALHGMSNSEEICFASRDGLQLGGWWIPAPVPARGAVILCPGQNGSLDKDIPQAVPLHKAGFHVLMFDFRAHGRSEGNRVTFGALEQDDLLGAVDYVTTRRGIEWIALMGFSIGAGVALLVAAQDDRIAALVVDGAYPRLSGILAGWGRIRGLPDVLARGVAWLALLIGSLRARCRLYRANPIRTADQITVPLLFIHGEQDPFVSSAGLNKLAEAVSGPVEIWALPDAGHREAFVKYRDEYNSRVTAWFEQHLALDNV
jgi:alpha-beta hydrolase superfamily lysophospholipase